MKCVFCFVCVYIPIDPKNSYRSLQLTEKMPKRTHQETNRITVHLGDNSHRNYNEQPRASSAHRHSRGDCSRSSVDRSNIDYQPVQQNPRYHMDLTMIDYDEKYLFDKSRSFDDDYRGCKTNSFGKEYRSKSNDRVYSTASIERNKTATQDQRRSYGRRLYDHEMMYDFEREAINRSPIIEFGRSRMSRDHTNMQKMCGKTEKIMKSMNRNTEYSLPRKRDPSPRDEKCLMAAESNLDNNKTKQNTETLMKDGGGGGIQLLMNECTNSSQKDMIAKSAKISMAGRYIINKR